MQVQQIVVLQLIYLYEMTNFSQKAVDIYEIEYYNVLVPSEIFH